MKIIQVVGHSGSGKTTFIGKLAPEMNKRGRVAIIKHMGHHTFVLEEGKDTTLHYTTGVELSVGVDDRKSVITLRTTDLYEILDLLADQGIKYVIIEGFKTYPFPSIVIGDLETDQCILRDPSVDKVISSSDDFYDYYTLTALIKEVKEECKSSASATLLTFSGIIQKMDGDERSVLDNPDEVIARVRSDIRTTEGILGVRLLQVKKLHPNASNTVLYAVIASKSFENARLALTEGLACLSDELRYFGFEISGFPL
jgi:molybdopterin synthase catalytic subunit